MTTTTTTPDTLTPWADVPVCDCDGDLDQKSPEWWEAMREYHATRAMSGCWPCTHADLDECGPDNDPADAGLDHDAIDWSGFSAGFESDSRRRMERRDTGERR